MLKYTVILNIFIFTTTHYLFSNEGTFSKYRSELITEEEISDNLKNKRWLVSHGGVGSEYLTKLLGIQYPKIKINGKSFKECVVHFPHPVNTGPKLCLYLYGDIFNSIISQIPRHPYNPAKLHNNKEYPRFYDIESLLEYSEEDPFGLWNQIKNFMSSEVDYKILVKEKSSFFLMRS